MEEKKKERRKPRHLVLSFLQVHIPPRTSIPGAVPAAATLAMAIIFPRRRDRQDAFRNLGMFPNVAAHALGDEPHGVLHRCHQAADHEPTDVLLLPLLDLLHPLLGRRLLLVLGDGEGEMFALGVLVALGGRSLVRGLGRGSPLRRCLAIGLGARWRRRPRDADVHLAVLLVLVSPSDHGRLGPRRPTRRGGAVPVVVRGVGPSEALALGPRCMLGP
mmetsp:Transcript_32184/g.68511  ORF Transcript_32184/g.68511 Transcript_32184/m.68511 type:complete len:217 (-) Transcript_32184:511-1161(-)